MSDYRYVILGGGMVAGYAAKELAEKHGLKPGELCVLSDEQTPPYERPPLSKDFLTGKVREDEILISDQAFYRDHGIDLRLGTPVTSVDFDAKALRTDASAGGVVRYEKLLVATGASPRTLDVPGGNLDGVLYLRSVEDARRIRERATGGGEKRVVVIGGGYIGLEASASLKQAGADSVTVVLSGGGLLPRLFTPEMSAFFRGYYERRGVHFVADARATAFTGDKRVTGVVLDSGRELPADLVVAGVGVAPNVALFEHGALAVDRREGIRVNEYLETSVPDVYAAGDATNYRDVLFDKQRHVEHWDNAVEGGKHAAAVMAGKREPFVHVPYFFSDEFDLSWEFWGDADGSDRVVYRGDVDSAKFSAWWLKEKRLVAAFVMNRPDDERDAAPAWIQSRHAPDPALLEDAGKPLPAPA
ncbi:MAG TPA: FAD-dependent oxidoreductase [Armatimonadaceae bacterium]|nr:FAD-dependent oxidoreductase [Armatimonadaceae bacterium]